MSLDVTLTACRPTAVYDANITHNLGKMAREAGIYEHLWRPEEIGITHARDLVAPLSEGVERMEADPEHFRKFNAPNGWGRYENLLRFVRQYIEACQENPDATVTACR